MNFQLNRRFVRLVGMSCVSGLLAMGGAAVSANPFSTTFNDQKKVSVQWQGRPLIVDERLGAIGSNSFEKAEGTRTEKINGWTVNNVWRVADKQASVTYRREVAVNDKEVELTVQYRVPGYYQYEHTENPSDDYTFTVPVKVLEGMNFRAIGGRGWREVAITGKITADMPDGVVTKADYESGSVARFIAFEDGNRHLIFDFNPRGVIAFNDYGPTTQAGYWQIVKKGENLIFTSNGGTKFYHGVYNAKVRILEGTFADYDKYHAHRTWTYHQEFPAMRQFVFGAGTPVSGWISAGTAAYESSRGYGWKSADGLKPSGDVSVSDLRGLVRAGGEKTFLVDVPQPGIYIFTVRTASDQHIGPFNLACDGQVVAKNTTIEPGNVQSLVFSCYTEGRQIALTWSGNWAAGSLAMQALIYKPQDFGFKRGNWLAEDVPSPTNLYLFKRDVPAISLASSAMPNPATDNEVPGATAVQSGFWIKSSPPDAALRKVQLPPGEVNVPSPDDPATSWRWWGSITGLGPANFGSFYEFETDEQISRRLDEIQKLGYRIVLINGLLPRHQWMDQLPRVSRTITRIVELAHARGMKILDHQDLTIVANEDEGYNVMVKHLDWNQRDVRNGQVTRGWCLNNPYFLKYYWKYITDLARDTGVDGLMIDETGFHGFMYCGCEYCREKFYQDTGVRLPYDGPVLMNKNDRLWKLWTQWRIKSVGDWHVELRRQLATVNPHMVLMKYTTDYGLTSSYASVQYGDTLVETARAVDFLGTETMSRNVYVTYRSNMAARQLFGGLRHSYGSPIFGLVYPVGQPVFAYSGWIQNNMHGQVTWAMTGDDGIEKDTDRYNNWKNNMDIRRARSAARVGILFSIPSRDFPQMYGHHDDLLGTVEMLNDAHIPLEIILNRDLTTDKLNKFDLLILPSACSMSDEELAAVRGFLQRGGNVLSSGHTGTLDELGFNRARWTLGEWIGLKFSGKLMKEPVKLSGEAFGDKPMDFQMPVMQVEADPRAAVKPAILARAGDGAQIAVAEGQVGKGRLMILVPRLAAANCESESTVGRKWVYEYNPRIAAVFNALIGRIQPANPTFKAVSIPTAVRTTVFTQKEDDGTTTTLVHFYNATAINIKKGETVPALQPSNPFPPIAQDMVFEITLAGDETVHGDVVSPDYKDVRPVKVESLGNHRYRITLAKADLVAYSMIRLR